MRFFDENQGVFSFGFRAGDARLFVAGDWAGSHGEEDWRPVDGASLEEGVVTMLLSNLFWMSMSPEEIYQDPAPRPADLDRCLWSMPGWRFDGFWTDATQSRLFYSGIEQVVTAPGRRAI